MLSRTHIRRPFAVLSRTVCWHALARETAAQANVRHEKPGTDMPSTEVGVS
jgi:hypothetical protein